MSCTHNVSSNEESPPGQKRLTARGSDGSV